MANVRYTALRSLIVGSGTLVTYTLPIRYAGLVRTRRIYSTMRRSLSGIRETYYESAEDSWSVSIKPLTTAQQPALKQFLDSVDQGETFEFAADGVNYVDAVLEPAGYTEPRDPALDSMMTYDFTITQVP